MLVPNLICIAIILSISNGSEGIQEDIHDDLDHIFREENPWEAKLSSDLANFQTESMRTLNTINRKIPDDLEDMHRKLKALEKKIPEKLEANLEKLQEYIDQKLSTLEKHINRKIDALDQLFPDKTVTNIINHKLDALEKIQLNLNGNNTCEMKRVANEIPKKIEDMLNKSFVSLKKIIMNITNANADAISKTCNENLRYQEDNNKKVSLDLKIIKSKLDVIENDIPKINQTKVGLKLDDLGKKIVSLQDNVSHEWETLSNKLNTLNNDFGDRIPELQNNIIKKIDALQTLKPNEETKSQCKIHIATSQYFSTPFDRLDNQSLNHIVYKSFSTGFYLYMHFAVRSDPTMLPAVILSREPTYFENKKYLNYVIGTTMNRLYKSEKTIIDKHISNGLSSTQYTEFYIKIVNDTLKFGKKDSSTPLITYNDPDLKQIQYFSFGRHRASFVQLPPPCGHRTRDRDADQAPAIFVYDCPPNVNLE